MHPSQTPSSTNIPSRFLVWLLFSVAAVAILQAAFGFLSVESFLTNAVPAPGIVVDFSLDFKVCGYHLLVTFQTPQGTPQEFLDPGCYHVRPYPSEVTVLYDPLDPSIARVNTFRSTFGTVATQASVALFLASAGALALLVRYVSTGLAPHRTGGWRRTSLLACIVWVAITALVMLFFVSWPVGWPAAFSR